MSQISILDENCKEVFGSTSKVRYDAYTDEELASDEFFWNQLELIVKMKNKDYLYHFMNARSDYIERMSGM